jgi:hypothetical protein
MSGSEYNESAEMDSAEWPGEYNEAYGDYSDASWNEARRRTPPPPVRTASRPSTYSPPMRGGTAGGPYASQQALNALRVQFNQQMTTNSNAIRQIDGRVRNVITEQGRQGAALRREIADRRRETATLQRDLQFTRELAAVIPFIQQAAGPGSGIAQLLPLVFLLPSDTLGSALGGSGTTGGSPGLLGGNNIVALGVIAATLLRP